MLDLWEIYVAPDKYIPGTFAEEYAKYLENPTNE